MKHVKHHQIEKSGNMMTTVPSFDNSCNQDRKLKKPRIQVIEVRDKENPDGQAIAWLVVERVEEYVLDPEKNILSTASIRIHYKGIYSDRYRNADVGNYSFDGIYQGYCNSVSLTGGAMLAFTIGELMGQRIGTYLFNEVVVWAKQWPEAQVHNIKLLSTQAKDENKERRNRFYERFGIAFDYTSPSREEGKSRPMKVSELKLVDSWQKNIKEHNVLHYISDILSSEYEAQSKLTPYKNEITSLRYLLADANCRPLRWALQRIFERYKNIAKFFILLCLFAAVAWYKYS
jgi:hypothetical protein